MVRATRSLFVFLLLLASLSLSQSPVIAQDERNETDFGDTPGADDSQSETDDDLTDEELFARTIREIQDADPAFGPESDEIIFDEEFFVTWNVNQSYQDLLISVAFEVPDLSAGIPYDAGIAFRIHGSMNDPGLIHFVFQGDGRWELIAGLDSEIVEGTAELLDSGVLQDFEDEPGASNTFLILAQDDVVQVGFGDELESTVEVPFEESGTVSLSAGNYIGSGEDGEPIQFTDLTIWEL